MGDANWKKSGERVFCFVRNEIEVAQLELVSDGLHALAKIRRGDGQYLLKRTGFWKTQFEIENSHGKIVLKNYSEKWYSGSSLVECNNIQYKLSVRNNPLAEWVIFDDKGAVILAYGLDAINKKMVVRLTEASENTDELLHCLLWVLILPVAMENTDLSVITASLLAV
jgi:hypothetical protein